MAAARPDLPRALTKAVDRALAIDPAERPDPKRLAAQLRRSLDEAERRREQRPAVSLSRIRERAAHGALAAAFVLLTTALLPFYPHGVAIGLAAAAALAGLAEPRIGLALALAVPVLPAGNVSLGLAFVYLAVAVAWLCALLARCPARLLLPRWAASGAGFGAPAASARRGPCLRTAATCSDPR